MMRVGYPRKLLRGATGGVCSAAPLSRSGRRADRPWSARTLPEGDADFSGRMRDIKAGFTRRIARRAERRIGTLRQRDSGLWQRRFWEHMIRDERDYAWRGPVVRV
jgi:hypothetical protein